MIAAGFIAVTFFLAGYALAQDHEAGHGSMHQHGSVYKHEGSHQHHQESLTPGKDLSLTPEQKSKLQDLHRKFALDNAQLIGGLVAKKIEVRALWSDPKADPKSILEKEKELASFQFQLREKIIQAKLEVRTFLTPEQMAHFGRHWGRGFRKLMGHGAMMGHEERMGSGRGIRHAAERAEGHGMGHGLGGGMGHGTGHGMGRMGMCQ